MKIVQNKYQCKCCENYTLDSASGNTFQLCPVCFWEDDGVQSNDRDYEGGANIVSLNQAQKNYKKFGAAELQFVSSVRLPLAGELK